VVLAAYMHSRAYRDPGKAPEADVEAVRDWLVLVNFHGYFSANPSGRLQKDIETDKGSCDPFPFYDLLSNIKDISGWCNNNNCPPHDDGSRSRSVMAIRTTLPIPSLHNSLPEQ
jgi:hypothetical protein